VSVVDELSKTTMHVFIDTNVFLDFFAFSKDDLVQLQKLVDSIRDGSLKLYLPREVIDEFDRNREKCIKETLDQLSNGKGPKDLPHLAYGYPQSTEFEKAVRAFEHARGKLIQILRTEAANKTLAADRLFESLRVAAGVIETSSEVLGAAQLRKALGNPPGKGESLGDQLNWETLLRSVAAKSDLYIVSRDPDYKSPLDAGKPRQYLADEWKSRNGGDLRLYAEIKLLLDAYFPMIQLRVDQEKKATISALENSLSFASTHELIAKLQRFTELLSTADIAKLAHAAIENEQIRWILTDSDVAEFYAKILPRALQEFPPDLRARVTELFSAQKEDGDEVEGEPDWVDGPPKAIEAAISSLEWHYDTKTVENDRGAEFRSRDELVEYLDGIGFEVFNASAPVDGGSFVFEWDESMGSDKLDDLCSEELERMGW
jgi:predicted nucleic acid-binding protein